ncbi:MAG TPA: DUF4417 domain-containing protein [Bacilli bacterium]|nr:DUF4417 domain-containing protein [Bacilli bacterium]
MVDEVKKVRDDFQAFLVDGAEFTGPEDYPVIKEWMISDEFPEKIVPFNKIKETKNIEDYYICFYCQDVDFLRIKRNPRRYIGMLQKSKGIIGLDFSVYIDMPKIVQKKQMFDNLALTYFYGANGIKVIPNIRYGIDELTDDFLNAIPKGHLIAIGTYGFIKTVKEQNVWFEHINKIIETLEPKGIIVYGSLPKDFKSWLELNNIKFKVYESYHSKRMREVKNNVNKG